MTVVLVYGDIGDGYLLSGDASYATARNGPADSIGAGSSVYYGQRDDGTTYTVLQGFLRFALPSRPATEIVTTVAVRTYQSLQASSGVTRDMEMRQVAWGPTLETADWRNPSQLSSAALLGRVLGVQTSASKWAVAGSETLRSAATSGSTQEMVLISSRQRAGTTPTGDESSAIVAADQSGTTYDPVLVYTTTPLTALRGVMGAHAQLSDGSWVYLTTPVGTGVARLLRQTSDGTVTELGSLPLGSGTGDWYDVYAAQGISLAVDDRDNIYVVGRAGDAPNAVRHRAYIKGAASWTAGTTRTLAAPAHDAPINNITVAWHPTAGGTLMVLVAHMAGEGSAAGATNDVSWLLINSKHLLDGTSTPHLRASGSATASGLLPATGVDHGGSVNEAGSGLDVVTDGAQGDWGYLVSFRRSQRLGDSAALPVGRYRIASTGDSLSYAGWSESSAYGRKDGQGRARVLSVGSGVVAVVSADAGSGYGISAQVLQSNGTGAGWVSLGYVALAGESIPSMPDGPLVASSLAWDVAYSSAENLLWVYYVDAADSTRLMRTSISLDTYQATRVETPVYTSTGEILAVRVPRNATVTTRSHVLLSVPTGADGYVEVIDPINLAPTAPTPTPRPSYDATTSATFSWTFGDPNDADAQSAYRLVIERTADGTTALDTGQVASATTSHIVTGGALANEAEYRWRVMTWDPAELSSPWSDYQVFATSASGSVTITDPATDNPPGLATDDLTVSWSVTGTTPALVRTTLTRADTGAMVQDSGWQAYAGTNQSYVSGMATDVEHVISVQVENASGVRSSTGTRRVTPSYGVPETPVLSLAAIPEGGYVLVSVDNPVPQGDRPDVVRNRIYRRRSGTSDTWIEVGVCEPSGSLRDYTAPAQVELEYLARGEAA